MYAAPSRWFLCKVTALCGMRFQFLMWLLCSKKGWNWIFILITLSLLHPGGEMHIVSKTLASSKIQFFRWNQILKGGVLYLVFASQDVFQDFSQLFCFEYTLKIFRRWASKNQSLKPCSYEQVQTSQMDKITHCVLILTPQILMLGCL